MTGLITELSLFNCLHTTTLSCVLIASKLSSQNIYFVWKTFGRALPKWSAHVLVSNMNKFVGINLHNYFVLTT